MALTLDDYRSRLDADILAFIDKTASCYPGRPNNANIADIRADYEQMCQDFNTPSPNGLFCQNSHIKTTAGFTAIRDYLPANRRADNPLVIFFHGGGFVLGSLDSHDSICADLAFGAGLELVAVDYRLAPEHLYPAALEDCLEVIRHFQRTAPERALILAGDSAGAWLAASCLHHLRPQIAPIIGQLLIYPALGGDINANSYHEHAEAPLFTTQDMLFYAQCFFGAEAADKITGPLCDTDFSGLVPTIIFGAEFDPLSDDGPHYAKQINDAGGQAHCFTEAGLVHGYLRGRQSAVGFARSFAKITTCLKQLGEQSWNY